jgi:tyrosyl-tRNA synthetase
MDIEGKLNLIREVGEEIITEEELRNLLKTKAHPIAYDGFEPSGTNIHIAQGLLRSINVNKMTKAGVKFKMWVADWHAWANNKMSGNLDNIQTVGKYLIEVWKACGMDLKNIKFLWASDVMDKKEYWKRVMNVARNSTVKRIVRCGQIMGRKEAEVLQSSQIFYPCMQASDIFELESDITQLGLDQRRVNMLARELAPKLGYKKPVVVSHHMLMGLSQPVSQEKSAVERAIDLKMSKSKPETAIFMADSEEDVKNKINKAYCPENTIEENPVLDYCKHIIFEKFKAMEIKRPEKFGGSLNIESYNKLEEIYGKGKLHPMDLKNSVGYYLNQLLYPIRKKLDNNTVKKLVEKINTFEVTR